MRQMRAEFRPGNRDLRSGFVALRAGFAALTGKVISSRPRYAFPGKFSLLCDLLYTK
jgi:hypothetical protein